MTVNKLLIFFNYFFNISNQTQATTINICSRDRTQSFKAHE